MRRNLIPALAVLAGCTSGDIVVPADPDFARGGRFQVHAFTSGETTNTIDVEVFWSGSAAASYEVEVRGPLGEQTTTAAASPIKTTVQKSSEGFFGEACVRPEGKQKFTCDDVFIPAMWAPPPPPPPPAVSNFARPAEDVQAGEWSPNSGAALSAQIDEGQPNDEDTSFIDSGNDPDTAGAWIVKLGSVPNPGASTGHVFFAFHKKTKIGGRHYDMHYELWEGVPGSGELIASFTDWHVTSSYRLGTFQWNLSTAEAGSIGNYGNLYVRGFAVSDGGGQRRRVLVTMVELGVPEPPDP